MAQCGGLVPMLEGMASRDPCTFKAAEALYQQSLAHDGLAVCLALLQVPTPQWPQPLPSASSPTHAFYNAIRNAVTTTTR